MQQGRFVLWTGRKSPPATKADGSISETYCGVEVSVSQAAVEQVWYLFAFSFADYGAPADEFVCNSELLLRHALFEDTGGIYPELITRHAIKVFLPPIGNLTVYIFIW